MLRLTTALLLLSPAIASAQCLTAESLDSGITVEYGNGNTSYIQRQPDGSLQDSYIEADSYYEKTIFFESFNGVFETRRFVHEKSTWQGRNELLLSYDFPAETLIDFTPGSRGNGTQTENDPQYGSTSATFGWAAYEGAPLVIGDCTYNTVRVFTTSLSIRYGSFDIREITYLPELGFGLQVGNSYFAFSPDNTIILDMSAS